MGELVREASGRLAAAGCQTPRLDAELLLVHVLGSRRDVLYREPERRPSEAERRTYESVVRRRERREPVAYIVGRRAFRTIDVTVGPGVLVPRPETETLVEVGLEELACLDAAVDRRLGFAAARENGERPSPGEPSPSCHEADLVPPVERTASEVTTCTPLVLDLCTGSGCVALALASEHPGVRVVGVDVDEGAISFARDNATRLGLADRVDFLVGDLYAALPAGALFDVIVANPPYLSEDEIVAVEREISVYEPPHALVAGPTGLEMCERVIGESPQSLRPGGLLAVEIHEHRVDEIGASFAATGRFGDVVVRDDLGGAVRVAIARALR